MYIITIDMHTHTLYIIRTRAHVRACTYTRAHRETDRYKRKQQTDKRQGILQASRQVGMNTDEESDRQISWQTGSSGGRERNCLFEVKDEKEV